MTVAAGIFEGAGWNPARMAHGCAALLSAAGAAPGLAQGPVHQHADQLFFRPGKARIASTGVGGYVSANRGKGS